MKTKTKIFCEKNYIVSAKLNKLLILEPVDEKGFVIANDFVASYVCSDKDPTIVPENIIRARYSCLAGGSYNNFKIISIKKGKVKFQKAEKIKRKPLMSHEIAIGLFLVGGAIAGIIAKLIF